MLETIWASEFRAKESSAPHTWPWEDQEKHERCQKGLGKSLTFLTSWPFLRLAPEENDRALHKYTKYWGLSLPFFSLFLEAWEALPEKFPEDADGDEDQPKTRYSEMEAPTLWRTISTNALVPNGIWWAVAMDTFCRCSWFCFLGLLELLGPNFSDSEEPGPKYELSGNESLCNRHPSSLFQHF